MPPNFALRLVLVAVLVSGCGASKPPKAAADDKSAAAPAVVAPKKAAEKSESAPPPASFAPSAAAEVSKPSRPPIDTITAAKVAYVINYSNSAPHETAEKKCSSLPENKPELRSACMKKERSEFVADVIQFKRDAKDKVSWVTYRRRGETLFLVHRTPIELTAPTENSVTVVISGDDKGPRALFAQKKKFVVQVPNDYSIELDDPFLGKLLYDAKIDVVGQTSVEK